MRLLAQEYLSPVSSLGSPGIDELRWIRPVRAGDQLALRTTVEETRLSRQQAGPRPVRTRVELIDAAGDVVLRLLAMNLISVRPGVEAEPPTGQR